MKPAPLPEPVEFNDDRHRCERTGKTRYASQHAAAKTRGKRRNKGHRMRAYHCEACHGWHLTTQARGGDDFRKPKT